ncbi:MAG TPA: lysophospholipid acyltransferase family protein [Rhizomicrobium sp.]|jgi:1-acyl-sn-glycerol-3-phosphate acyltransferase|nr:lysophospholipid acyltransferase family protein [Rhizomicrobium sp.]
MRSLRAGYVLFVFLLTAAFVIPWQSLALRTKSLGYKRLPFVYQRFLMKLFDIRVTVLGTPIQNRGVLMVSNHTSYLDILVLGGTASVSFVAKAEVANWFMFGTFARLQRTVFVERERRSQTGASRDQIRERLLEGDALILFPEGTSNDGNFVLPFKSALMGAAEAVVGADAQGNPIRVPVQPVSVSYTSVHGLPMGREFRPYFAWYGDMELIPHLWEALVEGPIDVTVQFHPAMTVDAAGGRKALAARLETIIRRGQAQGLAGRLPERPGETVAPPQPAPAGALA